MRLLLVEDNPLVGTMLRVNLGQEGFEVHWHTTGESALLALEQERFDLALLDIGLAGISGIEVAVDVAQVLSDPMNPGPGESATRSFFLAVGGAGGSSATAPLLAANPGRVCEVWCEGFGMPRHWRKRTFGVCYKTAL